MLSTKVLARSQTQIQISFNVNTQYLERDRMNTRIIYLLISTKLRGLVLYVTCDIAPFGNIR